MQVPQISPQTKPTLVISGLVRDAERTFKREYKRINRLLEGAAQIVWIVVESDSKDATAEILKREGFANPNFYGVSLGSLEPSMPNRMARLAHCRNAYLEKVLQLGLVGPNIYLVVLDLDGLNTKLSQKAIMRCVANKEVDVHTANQAGPYYDISALRADGWVERDCWQSYTELTEAGLDAAVAYQIAVGSKMIRIPRKASALMVESAFGGAAIYKTTILGSSRYDATGGLEGTHDICEHVGFHRKLLESGARISIAPWLINSGYNEHTAHLHPIRVAVRPLIALARKVVTRLFGAEAAHEMYKQLKKYLPL